MFWQLFFKRQTNFYLQNNRYRRWYADEENENIVKYRINLAKVYKKYYTLNEELTRFEKALAVLTFNKLEDLRKISEEDEMLMRVVKKISELTDDPDMVQFIDVEKGMELGRK